MEISTNPFKPGQQVRLKADNRVYTIYGIYSPIELSLSLYDLPDVEQDFQTHIDEIEEV